MYINGNENTFSAYIGMYSGVKEYAQEKAYKIGDIVYYEGLLYSPIVNNPTTVPTNAQEWKDLTSGKANKGEGNSSLAEKVSKIESDLADKADKAEVESALSEKVNTSDVETNYGKIARRDSNDRLSVPYIPTLEQHATSKRYVDNGITAVSKRVDNLEGLLINYTEDSTEAYAKKVPTKAAQYAILNRVGGKTIKKVGKNICTDAVEGGISMEGFGFSFRYTLPKGTYWIKCSYELEEGTVIMEHGSFFEGGWQNPVTLDEESTFEYALEVGSSIKGKFYPMIIEYTEGITEVPTEYEPYEAPSLEPTKVTEIVSVGKNRLPSDVLIASNWKERGGEGNRWDYILDLSDGWHCISMKLKGDNPNKCILYLMKSIDGGKTYTSVNAGYDADGKEGYGYLITSAGLERCPLWFKVDNAAGIVYTLRLYDGSNAPQNFLDAIFDAQIEAVNLEQEPSTSYPPKTYAPATEHKPYREPIIYEIPKVIQDKPRYGEGIGQYHSYIDFRRKKFMEAKINTIEFTGDDEEPWYISSRGDSFRIHYEDFKDGDGIPLAPAPAVSDGYTRTPVVSTHYDALSHDEYMYAHNRGIFAVSELIIVDPQFTDLESFKNFLRAKKSSGEPVIVSYATGEFEEHDLSNILTDYPDYKFIEVEGKGEIIAVNENKNPVPWTVTFAEV